MGGEQGGGYGERLWLDIVFEKLSFVHLLRWSSGWAPWPIGWVIICLGSWLQEERKGGMEGLLRGFKLRSQSETRHKKLMEEKSAEPVMDGVTFYVKYLGSSPVDRPSGEEATSGAIKTIIAMARKHDRKVERVALTISLRGIKVVEVAGGACILDFSIYRVSYCSADLTYDHVFAFIVTNREGSLACHAFLCPKRKVAQADTLTIAQAFNLAFKVWEATQEKRRARDCLECSCQRRRRGRRRTAEERNIEKDREGPAEQIRSDGAEVVEAPLIDLSSPRDDQEEEEEDMLVSFTQLARRRSPLPILRGVSNGQPAQRFLPHILTSSDSGGISKALSAPTLCCSQTKTKTTTRSPFWKGKHSTPKTSRDVNSLEPCLCPNG